MISVTIYDDAWQEISTEFSPVYECGALKILTKTSSRISSLGKLLQFDDI
jgi:hypothetical protein